jgi:cyclophilin family peptidyl-prolyl cis-trans isomerase/methionine-rich copper-binding protein CopC
MEMAAQKAGAEEKGRHGASHKIHCVIAWKIHGRQCGIPAAIRPRHFLLCFAAGFRDYALQMRSRILFVITVCFALALNAIAQTPVILSQPQSITVNNASAADFTVAATNAAGYQWQFDGASLAGATNSTLSLDDVSTNQAGSYTVVVTSSNNIAVTSAPPAVLTIVAGTIVQWTVSTYPGGGSSNFLVQLFDHDKPATVENFIHYITSGSYANTFFERDVTNFVLQGGDYVTADRASTNLSITNISTGTNIFPSQVDNEFGVGPLIHNRFGTLAMALQSGETNSATSSFFFNLADNSTNLDSEDFTVFGRILYGTNSGSNVLQYFSTLSAPSNGICTNITEVTNLPVNYDGTNAPTDASLLYCDVTFQTPPPVDTTPPTVSITVPAPGALFTNASTVTAQGAAQDNVGLAEVFGILTSSNGVSTTNAAVGTTNWSLNLGYPNGLCLLTVYAQDGAGNLSAPATVSFTATIPPIIFSGPSNLSALTGSSASFSVTASNTASYQWQLAGSPIAGATNSTLVVADVATNQSGASYDVVVTAPDSQSVTSAPAVLTVVTGTLVQITFCGFPDGSTSNVVVQLYDHEKPATVANFLHYIKPAYWFGYLPYVAYTNMIWDRCIPGYILQGGDYDAPDRTNETAPNDLASTLYSIHSNYTENSYFRPPFATRVDNEFGVGPLISNTFGTLAMSKVSGYPDSAANSFFFNLADNSASLDTQNGGYTVFGRLLPGSNYLQYSNVLQYFNTLSKPNRGIFDSTTAGTNQALTGLPVNYHGLGLPADDNLFFADFTLLSTFDTDTNSPTVAVSFPTNGQTMTNAEVVVQGTASDDVGVAYVACLCSGSNYTKDVYVTGTTNWTVDLGLLPPGEYTNLVYAQNGAGTRSTYASNFFVVPQFPFMADTSGNGTLSTNYGTNTPVGTTNFITAKPGKGAVFANWVSGTNGSLLPTQEFIMQNGLQITANFISNNVPDGVAITSPRYYSSQTNTAFAITGKLAAKLGAAQVTCQIFSGFTSNSVSDRMVVSATNNVWSTPPLSLSPGYYIAQALAQDAGGRGALVNQPFSILAPLTVHIYGHGSATITNGTYLRVGVRYVQYAEPAPGNSFLSWNTNETAAFAQQSFPFVMEAGFTCAATLVSNSLPAKLTITSPAANSQVTNPAVTFGGKFNSTASVTQVLCQVFQNNAPLTGFMPAVITGTTWKAPATNLTMGIYNVAAIATGASGHTAMASEQFTINFYPNIAGSYKGLFFDPAAISETNAGSISFRLTPNRPLQTGYYAVVNGNLTLPVGNYPFSVNMNDTGGANTQPTRFTGSVSMTFDVTNFSGQMTGQVTSNGVSVPLTAYRPQAKLSASSVPSPGHYVLSLEPETPTNGILNGPSGDSFAAVTVSANGNLAVAGVMADNASFSESTGVFTNGVWPLYASFYKGRGMLIGWETNLPSGECAGALFWIKDRANGLYYTNGLDEQINSIGTNYVRPASGVQYQIVFGSGTTNSIVTNKFSFNAAGAMEPDSGATDQLKGSLVTTTGVLKGSIVNPVDQKTLDFNGVFLGPSPGGAGFTLETGSQTGWFEITPVSP